MHRNSRTYAWNFDISSGKCIPYFYKTDTFCRKNALSFLAALCMFFAAHSFRIAENSPVGYGPGAAAARSKRRHRLTVRKGGFLLHSSGRTGKGVCEPTAIVYTSSTGCTRQYALLLGTRTGLPVYALDETCWSCCSTAAAGAAKRTWPRLRTGTGRRSTNHKRRRHDGLYILLCTGAECVPPRRTILFEKYRKIREK